MVTTDYECKINGVQVFEVTITLIDSKPRMVATYATVERGANVTQTHGRCSAFPSNWSAETLKRLDELLTSMERDLIPQHFKVGAGLEVKNAGTGLEPGGLKEVDQV